MTKVRNSSYELLKIISMLMIIMGHILCHGKVLENSVGVWKLFFVLLYTFLIVHVNCFVLITGYFQSKNNFKLKKILALNNKAWFYRVIIITIFIIFSSRTFGKLEIFHNIVPIPLINEDTWFLRVYLVLYLLTPFLNKLMNSFNKKEFQFYLLVLFILFSFLPTITNQMFFNNSNGYSIQNFIFLYSIGAYLRLYPLENLNFFQNKSLLKKRLIYILIFIFCFVINATIYIIGMKIEGVSLNLSLILTSRPFAYDNPLVILGAICFFSLFGTFNLKSKLINDIAHLTFGVYLIHDNYLTRSVLYKFLGFNHITYNIGLIINIICFTFIIFLLCMTIDYFVNILFTYISKNWLVIRLKNKFNGIFERLKLRGE